MIKRVIWPRSGFISDSHDGPGVHAGQLTADDDAFEADDAMLLGSHPLASGCMQPY